MFDLSGRIRYMPGKEQSRTRHVRASTGIIPKRNFQSEHIHYTGPHAPQLSHHAGRHQQNENRILREGEIPWRLDTQKKDAKPVLAKQ